jgi:serine/threonine protein kinase/cyclophilin family peptidyl-prolyl cis-trans isomerase
VQVTTFGRYRLLDLIGRGASAKVYRADDTVTDQVVAVKVLARDLGEDPEFLEQFRRDVPAAAGLNNRHVVPIHNFGQIGGQLYVDMQLIDGANLGRAIRNEGGRILPARAVAIIAQLAAALESAHRVGLVHRDVKPSNILIAPGDFVYLTDFGLARSPTDTAKASMGHIPGAYTAPERFSGAGDSRADVYSLACVLHKCLTGQQPYPGDTFEEQRTGHLTAPPPRPSTSSPGIPPTFNAVIAAGMAKSPQARYQTASQLAEAARAALDNRFIPPPSPPPGSPATPRPRMAEPGPSAQSADRGRALAIVGGLAAVLAALFGVIALVIITATTSDRGATETSSTSSRTATTSTAAASSSTATTTTTTSAPVARPAAPKLPPFVPSPALGANCLYPPSAAAAGKAVTPPRTGQVATTPAPVDLDIVTNRGKIGLHLANNESPCAVRSFVSLAQQKFFDNTQCHRLTTSPGLSVLQCGDPKGDGSGGPGYQFADEYPTNQYPPGDPALKKPVVYPRGTLAMANAGPFTNGSQFFMVYRDSLLPPAYTVFGTIDTTGLAVVDKIAAGGVAGGGEDGVPATTVTITSASLS